MSALDAVVAANGLLVAFAVVGFTVWLSYLASCYHLWIPPAALPVGSPPQAHWGDSAVLNDELRDELDRRLVTIASQQADDPSYQDLPRSDGWALVLIFGGCCAVIVAMQLL